MPIPRWWTTGRHGVGIARPAQRVGEQLHTLPQAEHGDLQYSMEGVICGGSARGGDIIGCGVDGGGGSGVGSANAPHFS